MNIFRRYVTQLRNCHPIKIRQASSKEEKDLIGPPNHISNLRPIKFAVREKESKLEKSLRELREETQKWNEKFWTIHNTNFIKEKEEFIKSQLAKKGNRETVLSADEMSVFYKYFLDKNWQNHFHYNIKWHKKNFYATYLDLLVRLQRLFYRNR